MYRKIKTQETTADSKERWKIATVVVQAVTVAIVQVATIVLKKKQEQEQELE